MRRIVLVSLALALVLGLVLILWSEGGGDGLDSSTLARSAEDEIEKTEEALETPEAQPVVDTPETARAEVKAEAPAEEAPTCVVLGRVVDEYGEPIEGVKLRLAAYKVWAEGVDVPRLPGRYDMRGFEVFTDAAGAFRIEAPPPTTAYTSLNIEPGRFHDSHVLRFNSQPRDGSPPVLPGLTAGVRDVGELRLATTGALRGRVIAEGGTPLADVEIDIGPGRSTTYSRGTTTAEDGTYVVAHAPIGTYAIKADLDGYLSGYIEPVTVEARHDTTVKDFVLSPAPSIEGVVTDENGTPLEGVRFWGWPSSSGSGAGAESDAEGRFVVYLPQAEPYTLGAQLDGYRTWGDEHGRSKTYAPGTRDLEVVMHSQPRTRFAVVDAETGAPIERFGLNILEDDGSRSKTGGYTERRHPPLRDHEGGVAEATGREGIDLYVVAAEGYLLATGDVAHDTPGEPYQTVRMERGAIVRGRVLREREAVPGAQVEIVQGWMRRARRSGAAPETFRAEENTLQSTATDAQGRFEIIGRESGVHRVTVRPKTGAPLVVLPVELRGREDRDLGDLTLTEGAEIVGEVLLPPGVEPAGLKVYLDDWRDDVTALTDARGRFTFADLAAGTHTLTLDDRPGELAGSDAVTIEVSAGETRTVTLDARDRAMCAVTLVLDLGGLPLDGRQVDLISTATERERDTLGTCDKDGRVTGSVRAWGETKIHLWLPDMRNVEHPDVRLDLQPRGNVDEHVRFELARVEVVLPDGVAFPHNGTAELQLRPTASEGQRQEVTVGFAGGAASDPTNAFARAEANRILFTASLPGSYALTLELVDDDEESETAPVEGRLFRFGKPPYYSGKQDVVLIANEKLEVDL